MAEGTSNTGNVAATSEGNQPQEAVNANETTNAENQETGKETQETNQSDVDNWFNEEKPSEVKEENTEPEASEDNEETPEETEEKQEEKELHKFFQKIQDLYKDDKFEEDSQYLDKGLEHLENLEKFKTERNDIDQKLIKVFQQYPTIRQVMVDLIAGMPDRAALAKVYKPEDFNPVDGDDQMEALKKSHEERLKKQTETEERNKLLSENEKKSIESVTKFLTDNKLEGEAKDSFVKKLDADIINIQNDLLTPEFLAFYYSAITRDKAIEDAAKQATIKKNNEKIVENRKKQETDGVPKINQTKQIPKNKPEELSETMKDLEAIGSRYNKIHIH